jgi:HTH-type transcriptional regulator/antitoxin HigA
MEPMAIQTEAEYEAALAEVSGLMDAEEGSSAGAWLDALVTRIEEYEARRWRIAARRV